MGANKLKKKKKHPRLEKHDTHAVNTLWQELTTGVAAVWKEDLEDKLGALGKTVNFLVWVFIIVAAPVAIHLIGWILYTLSELMAA